MSNASSYLIMQLYPLACTYDCVVNCFLTFLYFLSEVYLMLDNLFHIFYRFYHNIYPSLPTIPCRKFRNGFAKCFLCCFDMSRTKTTSSSDFSSTARTRNTTVSVSTVAATVVASDKKWVTWPSSTNDYSINTMCELDLRMYLYGGELMCAFCAQKTRYE